MDDLRSKTFDELAALCLKLGFPGYKSKELFRAIHSRLASGFDAFTFLSKAERALLEERASLSTVTPIKTAKGRHAEKAALKLSDGSVIEGVAMEYESGRKTLCLSSQVGCPVCCSFCATGKMGFKRNLSVGEILSQAYYFIKSQRVSNIVFMGMGEPFLNYNNVIGAAKILNHPLGQNISARKIVFSTIGIVSGIKKLASEPEQFRLAWSLVSSFDRQRKEIIPFKFLPPVDHIIRSLMFYQHKTGRRVTIEYLVIKGINDSWKDVKELVHISRLLDSHVNLIPFNPVPHCSFRPGDIKRLFDALNSAGINVTVRKSFGKDIHAACGQLAA